MNSFPSTDLANNNSDVLRAANTGPVEITQYSKPSFVLMTVEYFEWLNSIASTQSALFNDEIPEDLNATFEKAMLEIIEE